MRRYDYPILTLLLCLLRQACGARDHNLVTVVMEEKKTDLNGALKWIAAIHDQVAAQFLADYRQIPSFGDANIDAEVAIYVDGLGNWVRANTKWSFEASAFFYSCIHISLTGYLIYRARATLVSKDLRLRPHALLRCYRRGSQWRQAIFLGRDLEKQAGPHKATSWTVNVARYQVADAV
jgi:hypothetical protein